MEGDEVSYETLQDMLRSEKRSNRLTPIPDGFWRNLQRFLQDVESEFLREQGKDPFSRKASMLRDRVVHAQQAADAVWTLRERKIAMMATAHVKEGTTPKGLTTKEKVLYNGLLELLQTTRQGVFAGTAAEAAKAVAAPSPVAEAPAPEEAVAPEPVEDADAGAEAPQGPVDDAEAPDESGDEEPDVAAVPKKTEVPPDVPDDGQVTIEALGDIPPFVGPDMQTYILKECDMATVPENIATLLVKRNKAKIVQTV